jgi:Ras association domain-containing protein 7/8
MDLKVWVEGMPRVVCGIHEQTTCRDVVRVLAQVSDDCGYNVTCPHE